MSLSFGHPDGDHKTRIMRAMKPIAAATLFAFAVKFWWGPLRFRKASTWAMMLIGFAGIGCVGHRAWRRRVVVVEQTIGGMMQSFNPTGAFGGTSDEEGIGLGGFGRVSRPRRATSFGIYGTVRLWR
jgi:hypothetical protein